MNRQGEINNYFPKCVKLNAKIEHGSQKERKGPYLTRVRGESKDWRSGDKNGERIPNFETGIITR